MKKIFILILVIGFISQSCNIVKFLHLMSTGKTDSKVYDEEIEFTLISGIIILKIQINGKEYDFVLDTGAPNVISSELARELNLKSKCKIKTEDSQGNEDDMEFTKLDHITIGGITYFDQGTAIFDFINHPELSCLEIDGIIGANLMKESIWQIDMVNTKIRITNDMENLKISRNVQIIKFSEQLSHSPQVAITSKGIVFEDVAFDYGSNSGFTLCDTRISDVINKIEQPVLKVYGMTSKGAFGGKNDTLYTLLTDNVYVEGIRFKNQIIDIKRTGRSTLGTEFLKNYITTLDWSEKKIYLEKQPDENLNIATEINSFGFGVGLDSNKLVVISVYENSPATKAGISLGDQVIAVNEYDLLIVEEDEYCNIVRQGIVSDTIDEISLTYINKLGESKEVSLKRKRLL